MAQKEWALSSLHSEDDSVYSPTDKRVEELKRTIVAQHAYIEKRGASYNKRTDVLAKLKRNVYYSDPESDSDFELDLQTTAYLANITSVGDLETIVSNQKKEIKRLDNTYNDLEDKIAKQRNIVKNPPKTNKVPEQKANSAAQDRSKRLVERSRRLLAARDKLKKETDAEGLQEEEEEGRIKDATQVKNNKRRVAHETNQKNKVIRRDDVVEEDIEGQKDDYFEEDNINRRLLPRTDSDKQKTIVANTNDYVTYLQKDAVTDKRKENSGEFMRYQSSDEGSVTDGEATVLETDQEIGSENTLEGDEEGSVTDGEATVLETDQEIGSENTLEGDEEGSVTDGDVEEEARWADEENMDLTTTIKTQQPNKKKTELLSEKNRVIRQPGEDDAPEAEVRLTNEKRKPAKQLAQLKADLRKETKKYDRLFTKAESANRECEKMRSENAELKKHTCVEGDDYKTLRNAFVASETKQTSLVAENASLRSENAELIIKNTEAERRMSQQASSMSETALVGKLQADVFKLTKRVKELEPALQEQMKENDALDAKVKSAERSVRSFTEQIAKQKGYAEALVAELDNLKKTHSECEKRTSSLTSTNSETLIELNSKLETLQTTFRECENKKSALVAESAILIAENAELRTKQKSDTDNIVALRRAASDCDKKNSTLTNANTTLLQKNKTLETERTARTTSEKKIKSQLDAENATLAGQIKTLKTSYEDLRAELLSQTLQVTKLNNEIEQKKEKISSLESNNKALADTKTTTEKDFVMLSDQLREKTAKLVKCEAALYELEEQKSGLETAIDTLNHTNAASTSNLNRQDTLISTLTGHQTENFKLQDKINTVQLSLDECEKNKKTLEALREQLKIANDEAKEKIQKLSREIIKINMEKATANDKHLEANAEIKKVLEQRVNNLEYENKNLEAKLDNCNTKISEVNARLVELTGEKTSLSSKLQTCSEKLVECQKANIESGQIFIVTQQTAEQVNEKFARQVDDLTVKIERISQENENLRSKLNSATSLCENEADILRGELKKQRSESEAETARLMSKLSNAEALLQKEIMNSTEQHKIHTNTGRLKDVCLDHNAQLNSALTQCQLDIARLKMEQKAKDLSSETDIRALEAKQQNEIRMLEHTIQEQKLDTTLGNSVIAKLQNESDAAITKLTDALAACEESLAKANEDIVALNRTEPDHKRQKTEQLTESLTREVEELRKTVELRTKDLDTASIASDERKKRIVILEAELTEHQNMGKKVGEQLDGLQACCDKLRADVGEKDQGIVKTITDATTKIQKAITVLGDDADKAHLELNVMVKTLTKEASATKTSVEEILEKLSKEKRQGASFVQNIMSIFNSEVTTTPVSLDKNNTSPEYAISLLALKLNRAETVISLLETSSTIMGLSYSRIDKGQMLNVLSNINKHRRAFVHFDIQTAPDNSKTKDLLAYLPLFFRLSADSSCEEILAQILGVLITIVLSALNRTSWVVTDDNRSSAFEEFINIFINHQPSPAKSASPTTSLDKTQILKTYLKTGLPLDLLSENNNIIPPKAEMTYSSDLAAYSEAAYIKKYMVECGDAFKNTVININQVSLNCWQYFTLHATNPTRYPIRTHNQTSEIAINNILRKIIRHLITRLEISDKSPNPPGFAVYNFLSDPLFHLVRYLDHNETK